MKRNLRPQFSRRDLLKVAGSTLFVPAFLRRAFAQPAPAAPPSLVLLMQTNGTNQKNFWPVDDRFDSPILHRLLTDPQLGPKTTLIKGVDFQKIDSPSGNGHDWGFHGLYSGYDSINEAGASYGGGPSLDQIIAKEVAFPGRLKSIHCGVHAVNYKAINAGRISFSASGKNQQLPCELDLYALYDKVFGSSVPGAEPNRAKLRLIQRRSVLDAVAGDLQTLQTRLGPSERSKLDIHLTAVRDFEQRLSNRLMSSVAACGAVKPSQLGVPTEGQGNEANAPTLLRLFMEFIAATVACNMVGVLSFQFGRGGDHFHYDWLHIPGMPADAHDLVAHLDNGDPEIERINTAIKQWYTELMSDVAQRLAQFPQGDGKSALDNSLLVWGNEIANGTHGMNSIPIVLIGGAAGRLKRTGYVVDEGSQPHQRLGATVLNIMGRPVRGFGGLPDCGGLQGLEIDPNASL
jgi:hypothetical protein